MRGGCEGATQGGRSTMVRGGCEGATQGGREYDGEGRV